MAVTPLVAIVGRPNTGKSSLFNRLTQTRQAITHDTAGTTRDANYATTEWQGHAITLVDTAGLTKAEGEIELAAQDQVREIAGIADMLVVVVDAGGVITAEDQAAARLALKTGKPVVLALGKADTMGNAVIDEWRRLGISTIVAVSAIHGRGTGDLLDAISAAVKHVKKDEEVDPPLRLALIGRPNVGKSSLLNSLLGKQQAVVSSIGGTTRDINATQLKYHGRTLELIDTAGLRRPGKIERGIEKYSALRTLAAVRTADICFLVLDANDGVVASDLNLAGQIVEAGCGLVIVMNKWDAVEKDERTQMRLARRVEQQFPFVAWAPLVFTSAITGLHVTKLLELSVEIDARRKQQLPTGPLNRFIEKLIAKQPPAGLKGRQPKINYVTQTGTSPLQLSFFCTYPDLIHWGYKRYIENNLREAYDLIGTPVRFDMRHKHGDVKYREGKR
jgi:GTPase